MPINSVCRILRPQHVSSFGIVTFADEILAKKNNAYVSKKGFDYSTCDAFGLETRGNFQLLPLSKQKTSTYYDFKRIDELDQRHVNSCFLESTSIGRRNQHHIFSLHRSQDLHLATHESINSAKAVGMCARRLSRSLALIVSTDGDPNELRKTLSCSMLKKDLAV